MILLFIILSKSTSLTYSVSFFLLGLCLESMLFRLGLLLIPLLLLPTTISDSAYDSKNLFFFFIMFGFAYVLLIMSAGLNLLLDFIGDFLLRFVYDRC